MIGGVIMRIKSKSNTIRSRKKSFRLSSKQNLNRRPPHKPPSTKGNKKNIRNKKRQKVIL
jgi:hypothetical protein